MASTRDSGGNSNLHGMSNDNQESTDNPDHGKRAGEIAGKRSKTKMRKNETREKAQSNTTPGDPSKDLPTNPKEGAALHAIDKKGGGRPTTCNNCGEDGHINSECQVAAGARSGAQKKKGDKTERIHPA
jgi:hypothetical protein